MKHTILATARDDILRQFRYYLVDQDKQEVANRFLEAIFKTVEKIFRTPSAGAPKHLPNETLASLRSWPVEDLKTCAFITSPNETGSGCCACCTGSGISHVSLNGGNNPSSEKWHGHGSRFEVFRRILRTFLGEMESCSETRLTFFPRFSQTFGITISANSS